MKNKKRQKGFSLPQVLIIGLLMIGGVLAFYYLNQSPQTEELGSIDTSNWETYKNNDFHFQIEHPPDWEVAEFPADRISPKFNIFKEGEQEPPFDHFSTTTNVSIFPHGIPTEGVLGETKDSNVQLSQNAEEARDYLLEDSTRWATYVNFRDTPWSWNDSGFVWARTEIQNHSVECRQDEQEVPQSECRSLEEGYRIVHQGEISQRDREIEKEILSSFKFLEPDKSNVIMIEHPKPYEKLESPLSVRGQARGSWYFEGSFSIELLNEQGDLVAQGNAQAQGDWMTESFVPFEAELNFGEVSTDRGALVFKKANPSGLPENAEKVQYPVLFGWDSYQNPGFGFSVKHPPSWKVREDQIANTVSFGEEKTVQFDDQEQAVFKSGFSVVWYDGREELPGNEEENLSLQEWILQEYGSSEEEETIQSTEFGVGAYPGILVRTFKPLGVTALVTRIFTSHHNNIYQIRGSVPSPLTVDFPSEFNYKMVFNQMISSFEFLN